MRRHTIRTTKILAMAITAAGCSTTAATPPVTSAAPVVQRVEAQPQPADKLAAETKGPAAADPSAQTAASPEPPTPETQPPAADPRGAVMLLAELRGSHYFANGTADYAGAARDPHYRPLCDADGYPLVGNVVSKASGPPVGASITMLCQQMRQDGHIVAGTKL